MKVNLQSSINFGRKLKKNEEFDYQSVLSKAREKVSHGSGKSILIIPATSLPQSSERNTGVGNLAGKDAIKFFEFAKKYWGINEVQILPMGHYFPYKGKYPIYSGTSMDLGNHVINLEDYIEEKDLQNIVSKNKIVDRVNFSNVVDLDSESEKILKEVFHKMKPETRNEFEQYKQEFDNIIHKKSIFRALREIYNTSDYNCWREPDRNLFNEDIVNVAQRNKRIQEIQNLKSESIEFYKFKNFLAEKSLSKAKSTLNDKGIRLSGDMMCHFSYEEVWGEPKAFLKDVVLKEWDFPVLDINSPFAEKILREKVRIYAKRFDDLRIDAAWTYITPVTLNKKTNFEEKLNNGEKFINIIEDEIRKVKGSGYDLKNIMYEFAADPNKEFNIYNAFGKLRTEVKDRTKIYTSDYLSENWGSADAFIKRGWGEDTFVIGSMNHDSPPMKSSETQINVLSKILNIPKKKLRSENEFKNAKFAEPLRAKNNMLFSLSALGLNLNFSHNKDIKLDYTPKIPENYEKLYFNSLAENKGYNPMDALEKQFVAQGLDKTEPELFKKIKKYRKILKQKESSTLLKKCSIAAAVIIAITSILCIYYKNRSQSYSSK